MQDQLVSFKVAKLAKEKGFDIPVLNCYNENGEFGDVESLCFVNYNQFKNVDGSNTNMYSAPTQSLLQKWLRDKHKLEVFVSFSPDWEWNDKDECLCTNMGYRVDWGFVGVWKKYEIESYPLERYNLKTYEEALDEGLYEALTLIKSE